MQYTRILKKSQEQNDPQIDLLAKELNNIPNTPRRGHGHNHELDELNRFFDALICDNEKSGQNAEIDNTENSGNPLENLPVSAVESLSPLVNETIHQTTTIHAKATTNTNNANTTPLPTSRRKSPKRIRNFEPDRVLSTAQTLRLDIRRSWKHLRPHERIAVTAKQILLTGALAFSVNLSHERQAWIMSLAPDERAKRFADEMQRHLRKSFGSSLPVAYIFELSPEGNLHVHGFVATTDHSRENTAKLETALKLTGGKMAGEAGLKQIDVRPLRDLGWMNYTKKDIGRTVDFLGTENISYSAQALSRLAKSAHEEERSRSKALRGKKTAVVTHTARTTAPDEQEDSPRPVTTQQPAMGEYERPVPLVSGKRKEPDTSPGMNTYAYASGSG